MMTNRTFMLLAAAALLLGTPSIGRAQQAMTPYVGGAPVSPANPEPVVVVAKPATPVPVVVVSPAPQPCPPNPISQKVPPLC